MEATKPHPDDIAAGDSAEAPIVPLSTATSFDTFRMMHSWSILTMCQASLHLMKNGRGAEHFRQTPQIMRIEVGAVPASLRRTKPWNSWVVLERTLIPRDKFFNKDPAFAAKWRSAESAYAEQAEQDMAKYGDRYIGQLPVLLYVAGSNVMLSAQFPVVALRDQNVLQDPRARGALEDLVTLCAGYINAGIPLQQYNTASPYAFPSRVVWLKKSKQWAKLPLGTQQQPFDNTYVAIFNKAGRKSDLNPLDLMRHFAQL